MIERSRIQERRGLAVTLSPLMSATETSPRGAIERLSRMGFGFVQLSATQNGLRPRDLDRSARRELLSLLRRHEMAPSGVEVWIPPSHFGDAANVDRAVTAVCGAIELAAELGRIVLSLTLPTEREPSQTIQLHADHHGVLLADHAIPPVASQSSVGIGVDPAAWLAAGEDPLAAVQQHAPRLLSARLVDLLRNGMRGPIGLHGDGRLDASAYRMALTLGGFSRPVIIDARQWHDPWSAIATTADAWLRADPDFKA